MKLLNAKMSDLKPFAKPRTGTRHLSCFQMICDIQKHPAWGTRGWLRWYSMLLHTGPDPPNQHVKQHFCNLSTGAWCGCRQIPGARWPARLAESLDFRFIEKPCFQNKVGGD